jgi:23S rRNA (adenine2030-N6)-methyltransferase
VNYRHAYHAGNFADCMKHALLIWLLRSLQRKPAGVFVLDTHAGAGRYDLAGGPAGQTGEWRAGIARLLDDPPPPLADYVALVRDCGAHAMSYPGSPALIHALLRAQDRLACCELHAEEYALLRAEFAGVPTVSVHRRDGWEAIGALLPPREKRGLVLIDPSYEAPDEFARLAAGLILGRRQFGTAAVAAWYPVKHRAPVRAFHTTLRDSGIRDVVAAELWLREPLDPAQLNGSGILLVNPPYPFEVAAPPILQALLDRLGSRELGEGIMVERVVGE